MARPRPGFKPSNGFKPGNCANPRGRAAGSRDKYPCSVWQMLDKRGDRDPIDVLSEFVSSTVVDPALRLQAAGMLASYKHGKRPAYRYIEDVVNLPAPQTLEEARQYLARLSYLVAAGRLDVDGAAAVKDLLQAFIDATVGSDVDQRLREVEEQLRAQAAHGSGVTVVVRSDLPRMPGTENLIYPGDRPAIEGKPNPWAEPDAGSAVDAAPKPLGESPSALKPAPGPEQPLGPKTNPESS
jgi:hypothetical protein